VVNPINGLLRPGKESHQVKRRKVWEVGHRAAAAAGLVLAIAAMVTGINAMSNKGMRDTEEYVMALAVWFVALVVLCVLREVQLAYSKRGDAATRESYPAGAVPVYTEMTEVEVGGSTHSAETL